MELYSSAAIAQLTAEQQARLEEVAKGAFRPCCGNGTHFPDCNHGMALLGLLELMASQDASVDEMFLAANRKDEGIYYTPAGITGPMADSLVDALVGRLADGICAAVGSQRCDFVGADAGMAQLAEIRVADTA